MAPVKLFFVISDLWRKPLLQPLKMFVKVSSWAFICAVLYCNIQDDAYWTNMQIVNTQKSSNVGINLAEFFSFICCYDNSTRPVTQIMETLSLSEDPFRFLRAQIKCHVFVTTCVIYNNDLHAQVRIPSSLNPEGRFNIPAFAMQLSACVNKA